MDSPTEFDPYVEWLEIAPALCPPNYYDLLGVDPFESDYQKIEDAYEYRLAKIRTYQTGPRGKYTQEILNEITRARICLTSPDTKREYDESLRQGAAKPPISIANLVAGEMPPVQENTFQITPSDQDEDKSKSTSATQKSKRLSVLYAAGCVIALVAIWGLLKVVRGNRQDQQDAAETSSETDIKEEEKKKEPKKIINIVEEKKGILPGANNSFLLSSANGKTAKEHPVVLETPAGTFYDQWQSADDQVNWEIWIEKRGYYEAIVRYTATQNDPYSKLVVKKGGDFVKKTKMRSAEKQGEFFEEEFVLLFRDEGTNSVQFSIEGDAGDFKLESITIRPNRTDRK